MKSLDGEESDETFGGQRERRGRVRKVLTINNNSRKYLSTCRRGLPYLSQNAIWRLAGASKHAEKVVPGSRSIFPKKSDTLKTYMARGQPLEKAAPGTTIHAAQSAQRQCRPRPG